jgi:ferredoxin-NADP reductase
MVMLAGGSGITPFMSFIEWATVNRPAAAIDLHYGTRSSSLMIYRNVIERCAISGLRDLRVRYYVEQPEPGEPLDDTQVVGRLSPDVAWNQLEAPAVARFYLSGPKAMIDPFRQRLVQLGAHESAVLSDDWA